MTRHVAPLTIVIAVHAAACVPSRAALHDPVRREVERRVGVDVEWRPSATDARVPAAVAALLRRPLDRDAAVRIALANSRRLQAEYESLGIAAAAIADATVLEPLEVDAEYAVPVHGSGSEIELDATQDILGLLQMPQRRGIAGAQLRAARARAVAATVELVAEVEARYYDLVAAAQELELRQTALDAASAGAEIIERMHAAGNTTDLELARELDMREQARVDVARAQAALELRREAINRLLGLTGDDTRWSVGNRLPELPADAPPADDIEREAVTASLELAALRADAEAAAGRVSVARVRTILPELAIGVAASRRMEGNSEGEWEIGPAIRLGLPLFNQQQGPRARAHAELRRAQNLLGAIAVELRAAARADRQRLLAAHAEARHLRDVVLPLRQRILEETLLQYNAMNASTFELLAARRGQVEAGRQYIDALRRYWNATADLSALRRGASATTKTDMTGNADAARDNGAVEHQGSP